METNLSRSNGPKRSEIRFEIPDEDLAVLDGFCAADNSDRTTVIRSILSEWSKSKLREATLICRVAGINPLSPDGQR